jgi:hypothetical protein
LSRFRKPATLIAAVLASMVFISKSLTQWASFW